MRTDLEFVAPGPTTGERSYSHLAAYGAVFRGVVAVAAPFRPAMLAVTDGLELHGWQWRELERELRELRRRGRAGLVD